LHQAKKDFKLTISKTKELLKIHGVTAAEIEELLNSKKRK
jgi:hypothetical protein